MDYIRLQNLRSLKDTGRIAVKPITLLVGENSSGKSTFLRLFPLLRQSVESRTTGPVLWYGRLVDFGSFSDAIRKGENIDSINLEFSFRLPKQFVRLFRTRHFAKEQYLDFNIVFSVTLCESSKQNATRVESYRLEINGQIVDILFNNQMGIEMFVVNGRDLTDNTKDLMLYERAGIFPIIRESPNANHRLTKYKQSRSSPSFFQVLFQEIRKYAHKNTGDEKIYNLIREINLDASNKMLNKMQTCKSGTKTWKNHVQSWTLNNESFGLIRDLFIANSSLELIETIDRYIAGFAENITYIAPLRATAERYYRLQDLAVDEVDFQGQNLAMFLRNLSSKQRKEYRAWMEEQLGFIPSISHSGGHISIEIRELGSSKTFNLADLGFGFSQILPVATQLWWQSISPKRRFIYRGLPVTLAIEQPELHLHPRLQAKFTDALIAVINAARKRN